MFSTKIGIIILAILMLGAGILGYYAAGPASEQEMGDDAICMADSDVVEAATRYTVLQEKLAFCKKKITEGLVIIDETNHAYERCTARLRACGCFGRRLD